MHWAFNRGGVTVHVEAWRVVATRQYSLRIVWPAGPEEVETFGDEMLFRQRLLALEIRLAQENWSGSASMMSDIVDRGLNGNRPLERRGGAAERRRMTRRDRRAAASIGLTKPAPAASDESSTEPTHRTASTDDA
jgi:hypothetical protein